MEQVIVNLVENAIKFSPEKGEVNVRSWQSRDLWRVEVRDQGIGIAADDIPYVMERFFRADSAKKAQIQGTGIGLFVCKAVVDGHNGELNLTSELGQGTCVSMAIPAR